MAERQPWPDRITPALAEFAQRQTSVFLGTASASGSPYIQHRGGPQGFLRQIDDHHLGLADLAGNRQYITLGNLSENPQAFLFLIDYAQRRRIKIWGRARVVEDDPELVERLHPEGAPGRPERAILFAVDTWDMNCPQHIPVRLELPQVEEILQERDARISELEAELARLKHQG